jgi:Skp family chaperone for outer membrane proteins
MLLAAAQPSKERVTYVVDLERAVLATAEGKRIRAQIEKQTLEVERAVHQRKEKLTELKRALEETGEAPARAQYEAEVAELDEWISTEEKKLDDQQAEKLAPILEAMRATVDRVNTERPAFRIVDASVNPVINPNPKCDATPWLSRAYESKKPGPLEGKQECRVGYFFYLDLEKVMKGLDESKRAAERLDAFQRQRQADLEAHQQELRRLEIRSQGQGPSGRRDYERARLDLAARFTTFQKELADREQAEEKKVRGAANAFVASLAANLHGAMFIDGGAAGEEGDQEIVHLEPHCSMTAPLKEAVDLLRACPSYAP